MSEELELYKRFSREFKTLEGDPQPVILELTKLQAWSLLCQVQLALRHPKNIGPTSAIARGIAEALQAKIATLPAMAEVARLGWNTKCDS